MENRFTFSILTLKAQSKICSNDILSSNLSEKISFDISCFIYQAENSHGMMTFFLNNKKHRNFKLSSGAAMTGPLSLNL